MRCYKCGNLTDKTGKCKECGHMIMKEAILFGYVLSDIEVDLVSKATKAVIIPQKSIVESKKSAAKPRMHNVPQTKNSTSKSYNYVKVESLKVGLIVEIDSSVYQIIEFKHVKPEKGAAFVRTKLKNIKNGGVIEKIFRPTEKILQASVEQKEMQYLYSDRGLYYFMDIETYEQFAVNKEVVGGALQFVDNNEICEVRVHNGNIFFAEPSSFRKPQRDGKKIVNTVRKEQNISGEHKPKTFLLEEDEFEFEFLDWEEVEKNSIIESIDTDIKSNVKINGATATPKRKNFLADEDEFELEFLSWDEDK